MRVCWGGGVRASGADPGILRCLCIRGYHRKLGCSRGLFLGGEGGSSFSLLLPLWPQNSQHTSRLLPAWPTWLVWPFPFLPPKHSDSEREKTLSLQLGPKNYQGLVSRLGLSLYWAPTMHSPQPYVCLARTARSYSFNKVRK